MTDMNIVDIDAACEGNPELRAILLRMERRLRDLESREASLPGAIGHMIRLHLEGSVDLEAMKPHASPAVPQVAGRDVDVEAIRERHLCDASLLCPEEDHEAMRAAFAQRLFADVGQMLAAFDESQSDVAKLMRQRTGLHEKVRNLEISCENIKSDRDSLLVTIDQIKGRLNRALAETKAVEKPLKFPRNAGGLINYHLVESVRDKVSEMYPGPQVLEMHIVSAVMNALEAVYSESALAETKAVDHE